MYDRTEIGVIIIQFSNVLVTIIQRQNFDWYYSCSKYMLSIGLISNFLLGRIIRRSI